MITDQEHLPAFDDAAVNYDHDFSNTITGSLQREAVWRYLNRQSFLKSPKSILEISCGTGIDACMFAAMGHSVVATDKSPAMIRETEKRIRSANLPQVKYEVCPIETIGNRFEENSFDLVFSDFGGLNCISPAAMRSFSDDCRKLLKSGGRVILVMMGKYCAWEWIYFFLKLQPRRAFRRVTDKAVHVSITKGKTQATWYHTPGEIAKIFANGFIKVHSGPVGFFLPPSYLDPYFSRHRSFLLRLNKLEGRVTDSRLAGNLSDHFILEFLKTDDKK